MASLIDSVKTVVNDSNPFFKLAGLAFFIFVGYELLSHGSATVMFKQVCTVAVITVLLGFILQSVHNNINEENIIMPNLLNPLKLIAVGLYGALALSPYFALTYYTITWVNSMLTFIPWVNYIILGLVFVVLFSFFVIGILLFCKNFNFFEGLNLLKIVRHGGDFIVYSFTLAISACLLATLIFFPIGLLVKLSFGYGFVFNYYLVFASLFMIMAITQYYCQLYSETIRSSNS
jgi:hypothetical protein